MGRYNGALHQLIDNATSSKSKWGQVLHYIEGHTVGNGKTPNPNFDSPLPPYTSPSVELEVELFDQQGPKREDTPLKIAMKNAPSKIVAALCHLGPEAAKLTDSRERLPIHWACRRSSENKDTEEVIMILAESYPEGLIHRDDGGRTPLHWLFWYHAGTRSSNIIKFMCQALPEEWLDIVRQPKSPRDHQNPLPTIPEPNGREIPYSSIIVPDARHGCLPIHYAVMQGATKEAIKILIQEYPASLACGDRQRRTPLAWYLGAGYLLDDARHVCGESNDPNATPWCFVKLSAAHIQLLVSSKVARQVDDLGRTPLHWACHFYVASKYAMDSPGITTKAIQTIIDNNIQAVTSRDCDEKTPLHTLFDTLRLLQEKDYNRMVSNRTVRDNIDLTAGGPTAFSPDKELIELLLKSPEIDGQDGMRFDPIRDEKKASAAHAEDEAGFLPLHIALHTATDPEIIQLLVKHNPTSLVHTSEELLQTPLVQAFLSPHTAPLQTSHTFELLMAAYVTSRHGTFMDGRLALKMEDAIGKYPIHYACQNQACVETIRLFVEKFPRSALFQNAEGDLPIHCLLSEEHFFAPPENGQIQGASLAQNMGLMTEKEIKWQKKIKKAAVQKMQTLVEPLIAPQYLKIKSSHHGMTPLHVVLAFDAVPYGMIYQMLDTYPDAARLSTTVPGFEFSCLDLHELHKNESEDADQWQAVRELLFSFYPLLASHRRKEDMLEACVNLIRNEVSGLGSYHLKQIEDDKVKRPDLEISETLSSIQAPEIDCAFRPKRSNQNTPRKNKLPAVSPGRTTPQNNFLPQSFSFSKPKQKEIQKSIYDDDYDDGGYVVSPQNSSDDDDDDDDVEELLSSEEEYFSDEESDSDNSLDQSQRSWDQGVRSGKSGASGSNRPSSRQSGTAGKGRKKGPSSPQYIEEKKEEPTKEEAFVENSPCTFTSLSTVAMRLWCFFVLYNDTKHPEDNYLRQVEAIMDGFSFEAIQKLMNFPVPEYAEEYLEQGTSTEGVTLRDVASPTSKALFHSLTYFLGEYEFSNEKDGVLLHRSIDKDTVLIRATRHKAQTQKYKPVEPLSPGAAEEAIWATGETLEEEGGYVASQFSESNNIVYFKLTRNQRAYENEVDCRAALGLVPGDAAPTNIVPLLDSYRTSGDSKKDKRFKMDINDDRFKNLCLYGGETICLADYPYALVYPYCDDGDLFDYFYHHGLENANEVSEIGRQVGRALKMIHAKGVVHGSLSMRSIAMLPPSSDDIFEASGRFWAVSDLSGACRLQAGTSYMGGISHNGSSQFETGLMPPEMFVKLSASEARVYTAYWETVEKVYKIKVDKRVVEPFVNLETGSTYVLRCHYVPDEGNSIDASLPKLPYELIPARETADVWCFGLLLFCLCSGGRPLFPANVKTGHLLGSDQIVKWDEKMASACIYEHVEDPLAQDILIHLLATYEGRAELNMETVLGHPFFSDGSDAALLGKMIDHRQQESAVHDRWRQKIVREKSEDEWLQSRTTKVKCWNFDLLKKFHFSASEIVRMVAGGEGNKVPAMPCGLLLLPYKLSAKNKKAKLAPTTKRDVERAERMGVMLLGLTKACQFAALVADEIAESNKKQWTASALLEAVVLPDGDFESLKSDLTKFAADHIEAFRADPLSVVYQVVASRLAAMKKFFQDSGKAYMYLVDEHAGIPLSGSSYAPYPLTITDPQTMDAVFEKILPFMHACTIYARGLSGGVSGLVRLIFEAAFPHIPPSWANEATGLTHVLEEESIANEISILHKTIASTTDSKPGLLRDDLSFIRDTLLRTDKSGSFAALCRVECAGYGLWTTKGGAAEIQEACTDFDFKSALDIQAALESKLKAQERQIRSLQEEVERLSFRKELNLNIPTEQSTRRGEPTPTFSPAAGRPLIPSPTKTEPSPNNATTTPLGDSNNLESPSSGVPANVEAQLSGDSNDPVSLSSSDVNKSETQSQADSNNLESHMSESSQLSVD